MYTLEELDAKIAHHKKIADVAVAEFAKNDKEYFNSRDEREASRWQAVKELMLAGAAVRRVSNGYADIVEGHKEYRYALLTGKWCEKGKSKHYRSKSPTDFVKRYVKKEYQDA